jgi:hypothetical protein
MGEECFDFFTNIYAAKGGEKQHAFSITFFTTNNRGKRCEKLLKKSKLSFKIFTIFP